MKTLLLAATFAAALAAAPSFAADPAGTKDDDTYASLNVYNPSNPHTKAIPASVEQSADMKAAESERREIASWTAVMGRSDRPQEYLGSGHK